MAYGLGLRRNEQTITLPAVEGQDERRKALDLGLKAEIAQNARFGDEVGSVTKRSPIGRYNATVETAYIAGVYRYYRQGNSTGYLLQVNSTTLRVGNDSTKTFSTLWTYSGTPTRMMAVTYQDLCYIATDSTNSSDNIMVTDGTVAWELGSCMAVISTTAGQLDTTAAYQYSIGYNTNVNGTGGTATIQGAIVKVTSGTTKGIDLTNIPLGNSSQNSRVIYRTKGAATTLEMIHVLGDNTTTSWTDTAADNGTIDSAADAGGGLVRLTCAATHGLQVNDRVTVAGTTDYNGSYLVIAINAANKTFDITDTWVSNQSGTWEIGENMGTVTDDVPVGQYLYIEQERLFITGDSNWKSEVYYSDQFKPFWIKTAVAAITSSARATDYYDVIAEDDGDAITGMVTQLGTTYVFKQNSIRPYYIAGTPNVWSVGSIVSPVGAPSGYSITSSEYGIIYQGFHYIYLFNGQYSQVIADEFTVEENIADARINKSAGYVWRTLYLLAYTDRNSGNSYHDRVMVYDLSRKQVSIDKGGSQSSGSGNVNINCFTSFKGAGEWNQLYAGDSNLGWVYAYENAIVATQVTTVTDLDSGTHRGTITATTIAFVDGGAGADTITDSGNAFLTSGFIAGQKIFVTGAGQAGNNIEMTIVSVVAGTITLATAIVTTEAAGATVTITSYQTDAFNPETNPILSRLRLDDMETYSTNALAQAGWVSSDSAETYDSNTKLMLHLNSNFTDSSASAHTVTAVNGAAIDTTTKKFGAGSCVFDGTNDHLTVPDHADWDFGSGDFTLEARVYFTSFPASQNTLISRNIPTQSGGHTGWTFEYNTASGLGFSHWDGNVTKLSMSASWSPSLNTWYHVALTRNGDNWRLLVDGTQIGTTYTASNYLNGWGGSIPDYSYELVIGCRKTGGGSDLFLAGYLDEVRISNAARWTANFTSWTNAYGSHLQCYSESSTRNEGTYSLEIEAMKTNSLNDTLSKTITEVNLSATAHDRILIDVYASRSGTNFQFGIGETGGVFTDNLVNVPVATANTWETVVLNFSSVADASKNKVIYTGIKITNADHDNVIYIDNIRSGFVGTATWTSPIYNINSSGGTLGKLYWNEDLRTKSGTYSNNVLFYIRLGTTSAACASASWSSSFTDPAGSDISGTTANNFFQFKCELIGADSTEYLYFPFLYLSNGYVIKATYTQAASDAESEVTFRYNTGFRNFGSPFSDKIYKRIVSLHEGDTGVFDVIATTDLQDAQVTTDNSPNTFDDISLTTYPKRWVSNFPPNMYGKELKLEFYKSDKNNFKLKQYAVMLEVLPVL